MANLTVPLDLLCLSTALGMAPCAAVGGGWMSDEPDPSVASAELVETVEGPNVGYQPRPLRQTIGLTPPAEPDAEIAAADESRLHLLFAVDYATTFYSRGFRYEDSGWIVQPSADLIFDVLELDEAQLSLTLGCWNSFHGLATDAETTDNFRKYWYESDLYAGIGLAAGAWSLEARYYFYLSPSDAFETIQELYFSATLDDSECMGEWALNPSAILAIETGSNANDEGRRGTYLQLGVAPGLSFEDGLLKASELSFPVSLGLSLSNYYEGSNGENDFFGFVGFGSKLSIPLDLGESPSGWTLNASLQGLYLGDAASTFNDGDRFEVIATVGLSFEF